MREAVIFLNGEQPVESAVNKIDFSKVFVICADGAYDYVKNICTPDLLLGDFDSIACSVPSGISFERFPVKKNYTDSQLCVIRAAELGYMELSIYGAFGLRPDHEQVNFSLLALADSLGVHAVLRGGNFDVFFLTQTRSYAGEIAENKTVSLVPYSDKVHIKYTQGLLYAANDIDVDKINIFTTSNQSCGGKVEYCLSSGEALLFVEN